VTTLADKLLNLYKNIEFSSSECKKELGNVLPIATDSIGLLAHSMQLGNTMRRRRITQNLEPELREIGKNSDESSEWLSGEDLSKKITDLKACHKVFQKTKSYPYVSSKNYQRFSKPRRINREGTTAVKNSDEPATISKTTTTATTAKKEYSTEKSQTPLNIHISLYDVFQKELKQDVLQYTGGKLHQNLNEWVNIDR